MKSNGNIDIARFFRSMVLKTSENFDYKPREREKERVKEKQKERARKMD